MTARMSRGAALALALTLTMGCGAQSGADSEAAGAADQSLAQASAGLKGQRDVCSGSPRTISGVIVSVGGDAGLIIDTGSGSETVYGLGPSWYWSQNGVERPAVGDSVVAVVSHVVTMEEEVILSITVNGQPLQLRDPSTCTPLW
jgi:hypothetical protein